MNESTQPENAAQETPQPQPGAQAGSLHRLRQWGRDNKAQIWLTILVAYVFLLGLGTVGEIWDVEWILELPLFRPPGKY